MAKQDIEFRVGVIILIGIMVLFGSLYWLQGYKLERNAQVISVIFEDVGTLAVGDVVTVSGVHRGKVSHLELTGDGVMVRLLLYKDVVLKQDAKIVIKNLGLMGERFIAISPGKDSVLFDPNIISRGLYDSGLPEVMGLMGEMIVELRSLVHSFKQTIGSDSSLDKFSQTVTNLESVTSSLSDYFQRNEKKLDGSIDNFYQASRELSSMLARNSSRIDSTIDRFDRVSLGLDNFVIKLDTISVHLRGFASSLDDPDGTLNLLISDRRLYDDLRRTADNVDDLITDIRANPRKYINLKIELF